MWAPLVVDQAEGLRIQPYVGVVLLPTRELVGSLIDDARTMDCLKTDVVAVTEQPQTAGNVVQKPRSTAEMVDIRSGGRVVGLHQYRSAAERSYCGFHREQDRREFAGIAGHPRLLPGSPEAASLVGKLAGLAEGPPAASPNRSCWHRW